MKKVLLVNGSPHEKGCTNRALEEVAASLKKEGVETEIFWLGASPISSCLACGICRTTGFCAIHDRLAELPDIEDFDGFVFGSPVHYAAPSGAMMAFMGRLFYQNAAAFDGKAAACVVSCRRAGSTAALEALWKFPTIAGMTLIGSRYWPMVHGNNPQEVEKDGEGLMVMRTLGKKMAYQIKAMAIAEENGLLKPEPEERVTTNFIR